MKLKTKRTMLIVQKYLWVIWCCACVFLFFFGIYSAIAWGIGKYKEARQKRVGVFLTDNLNTREARNGKVVIYNTGLKKDVGRYDQVFAPDYGDTPTEIFMNSCEGSVMVCDEDRYGFIDPVSGKVLVTPQYLLAWESDPVSGLAACLDEEHKLGFVNVETGQVAIPFQFELDVEYMDSFFRDGYQFFDFGFKDGLSLVPGANGKVGLIDTTGKVVLPIEYDDIRTRVYGGLGHSWNDKADERIYQGVVSLDGADKDYSLKGPVILEKLDSSGNLCFGAFDKDRGMIVPVEYDFMDFAATDDPVLLLCQKDGIVQVIDESGKIVNDFCADIDCDFSGYYAEENNVSALVDPVGSTSPYIRYRALNGFGVIDTGFRVVVMPDYYCDIEYLGNGVFACMKEEDYSVILKDGKYEE